MRPFLKIQKGVGYIAQLRERQHSTSKALGSIPRTTESCIPRRWKVTGKGKERSWVSGAVRPSVMLDEKILDTSCTMPAISDTKALT